MTNYKGIIQTGFQFIVGKLKVDDKTCISAEVSNCWSNFQAGTIQLSIGHI